MNATAQPARPLMTCGHVALATTRDGDPACPICDCYTIDADAPSLEGRKARCSMCWVITPSEYALPFFELLDVPELDRFYCGCRGWD